MMLTQTLAKHANVDRFLPMTETNVLQLLHVSVTVDLTTNIQAMSLTATNAKPANKDTL